MNKRTTTVTTYVVCSGFCTEKSEPTREITEAKAALLKFRKEHPGEFFHLEDRTAEVEL